MLWNKLKLSASVPGPHEQTVCMCLQAGEHQQAAASVVTEHPQTVPEVQNPSDSPLPSPSASISNSPVPFPLPASPTAASPQHLNMMPIALKILYFFMHEVSEAAQGWGKVLPVPTAPEQVGL